MKPNIYHYEDSEHVEDIVPETLLGRITAYLFLKVLQCIIFFCDAYRGYKRLHPVVKGLIWSALAGIGIGLLLVLVGFMILEGVL